MDTTQYHELLKTIQESTAKDWFAYLTGIGSLIASLLAVIIGLMISSKLSLKKRVLEKQLDTLFSLIQILQHQRFHIPISIEGEGYLGYHISILELVKEKSPESDIVKAKKNNLPIYFNWEGYHELNSIRAFKNNPFLPLPILKHLNNLEINNHTVIKKVDNKSLYGVPRVIHTLNIKENHKEREFERDFLSDLNSSSDEIYRDFNTFISVFEGLVEAVEDWLRKYEAAEINLNLRSKYSTLIS